MEKKCYIKLLSVLFVVSFLFAASASLSFAVLFSDSFESGDFSHTENGARWNGINNHPNDYVVISTDRAHTGTRSAKFHYAAQSVGGDSWAELRFDIGSNRQEIYIRWYVFFPTNFTVRNDPPFNNKFILIWGNDYNNDKVMAGLEFDRQTDTSISFATKSAKVYQGTGWVRDCSGGIGDIGASWTMDSSYLGRWVEFQIHDKIDSGAGDGAFRMWIDGVLVKNAINLHWNGAPCSPGYIRNGYLMGWANSGYSNNTDIYIDDVVFSDSFISSSQSEKTPNPVRGIIVTP